jgi:hypothetical protein
LRLDEDGRIAVVVLARPHLDRPEAERVHGFVDRPLDQLHELRVDGA